MPRHPHDTLRHPQFRLILGDELLNTSIWLWKEPIALNPHFWDKIEVDRSSVRQSATLQIHPFIKYKSTIGCPSISSPLQLSQFPLPTLIALLKSNEKLKVADISQTSICCFSATIKHSSKFLHQLLYTMIHSYGSCLDYCFHLLPSFLG